jgi:hypothetical protein
MLQTPNDYNAKV